MTLEISQNSFQLKSPIFFKDEPHSEVAFKIHFCMVKYVSSGIENTWDPNVILDLERRYLLNKAILRVSHAHFLAIKWPGIILSKTEYSHFQPVN